VSGPGERDTVPRGAPGGNHAPDARAAHQTQQHGLELIVLVTIVACVALVLIELAANVRGELSSRQRQDQQKVYHAAGIKGIQYPGR